MPELPEMETYKQLLAPRILHLPIEDVIVNRAKSINVEIDFFRQELLHHAIVSIERRAKHLLFTLDSGLVLLLHLMLGGSMFYGTHSPNRSAQVVLNFGEYSLFFIGLRLGYLHLHTSSEINRLLAKLGPEPLNAPFTIKQFLHIMQGRKSTLKATLVDQSVISGIGNCYSDEICFEAGLLPARKINTLNEEEQSRLFQAMRTLLLEAIHYGGYMDSPLYIGDHLTGQFDARCSVYDREGEPCVRCGNPLIKDQVSAKKCFYCLRCQH
ncbi:MAG: DNA-(Apurinic or apyrimidinic site) lyase [Bacilli bacterium]|nr:DNA-(Apurinic or apyrimidinic site) lyase [Bacilli bacterium]